MDKPRPSQARKKRIKRIVYGTLLVAVLTVAGGWLSRLEPAAPRVDRATIYPGIVERGPMVRNVQGRGKLVPEEIRTITSRTSGTVEQILLDPGVEVTPDTVLVVLSNPDLDRATQELLLQLQAAEIDLDNQRVDLQSSLLSQQLSFKGVEADYERARLDYEAESELHESGIRSDIDFRKIELAWEQAQTRLEMERQRLDNTEQSNEAKLRSAQLRLDQTRSQYELKLEEFDGLRIRAGVSGTLQQLDLDVGQQLSAGGTVARVAQPGRLKAELEIAETQAQDVAVGQYVSVDTRNEIIDGRVARIDPAVVNGTVLVDVRLEGQLPRSARPEQSVDGRVEIEKLDDVLHVSRPAFGQANSLVSMFKIMENGEAERVQVRFGRTSVSEVEILDGLQEGDEVILSDMSAWDEFDRVRLN